MIFSTDTKLLAVAGIVYALAGAAFICQVAFAAFPLTGDAEKSADRLKRRVHLEHYLDVRLGAVLLVAGFAMQLIGTLGTVTLNGPAALLLIALALGLIIYTMLKGNFVEDFLVASAHGKVIQAAPAPAAAVQPDNLVELRPAKAETIA